MNERAIKICLLTFNVLCLFVGLATLIIGILLYSLPAIQTAMMIVAENVSQTQIAVLSILMMSIGGLITFIAIVGCCGVMNESKCMIAVYCIFLFLLFVGQLAVGILGFVYKDQALDFAERFKSEIQANDKFVQALEDTFDCCGYDGPQDYGVLFTSPPMTTMNNTTMMTEMLNTTASQTPVQITSTEPTTVANVAMTASASTGMETNQPSTLSTITTVMTSSIPVSCCKKNSTGIINEQKCREPSLTPEELAKYVKTTGCKDEIINFIQRYELIIGAVSICFAVIELIALIAGCCLFKNLD